MKNSDEKSPKASSYLTLLILLSMISFKNFPADFNGSNNDPSILPGSKAAEIEKNILNEMERGKIPGLLVVIVKDNHTVYKKGFGFANIRKNEPVTQETLFEIGSNSKAFTGLGILILKNRGLLKLNDKVSKHIPWFRMKYKGKEAPITIQQLLNHSSGIPFETIADIPVSNDENALEATVRTLIDKELDSLPGEEYAFATINYDVLGLIIQKVSGQSFEKFIKNNLLGPLGLKNTYLSRYEAPANAMATGYKIGFLTAREFEAPVYRGNTPAAYFISNGDDMEKWLKIQLGAVDVPGVRKELIEESHRPIGNFTGFRCAKGWFVFRGSGLFHAGSNPAFSSFIVLSKPGKIGVALLANINSSLVEGLGWDILDLVKGNEKENKKTISRQSGDFYVKVDIVSLMIIFPLFFLSIVSTGLIVNKIKKILKNRAKPGFTRGTITASVLATLVLTGIFYLLSRLPVYLSYELPWKLIRVWAPITFFIAVILTGIVTLSLYAFSLLMLFFSKSDIK